MVLLSQVGHATRRSGRGAGTFTHVLTWAITRAVDESRAVVEQLIARGVNAVSLPCIERSSRDVAPWRPDGHRVVLLTSVAAVESVRPVLCASAPCDVGVLAPKTREAFLMRFVTQEANPSPFCAEALIDSSGGIVALAQRVLESLRTRGIVRASFWYPTSSEGLHTEQQRNAFGLLSPLGRVDRVIAYRLSEPPGLVDQLRRAPTRLGVVFTSPSAVKHFVSAARQLETAPRVTLAACWGESTLRAASPYFTEARLLSRTRPLAESLTALEHHHV